MSDVIIIGKGSSLLTKSLGEKIDKFNKVIRINHLPNQNNYVDIGKRTDIFACRFNDKYLQFSKELNEDVEIWHTHPRNIITEDTLEILKNLKYKSIDYLNIKDLMVINENFNKHIFSYEYSKSKTDLLFEYSFPDTGFASLIMCMNRFKDSKIYVCGYDNYRNKNENIYETKSDSSIFKTPVLSQEFFYRYLINKKIIHELK